MGQKGRGGELDRKEGRLDRKGGRKGGVGHGQKVKRLNRAVWQRVKVPSKQLMSYRCLIPFGHLDMVILQLGGENKHSDGLGDVHYLSR